MADRKAIIDDIRKNYGNMLNISQLAKVFNCERHTVPIHITGLPYLQTGKEKKYLASDIGRRISERMIEE